MNKKITVLLAVLMVFVSLFTGCNQTDGVKEYEATLYFLNQEGTKLVPETRTVTYKEDADKLKAVLEELLKGPTKADEKRVIPEGTTVMSITTADTQATIDFSEQFRFDNEADSIFGRTSVVRTVTGLEGIDKVQILVGGKEMVTSAGDKVGVLGEQDIVYDTQPASANMQYVKLYFADETGSELVAEAREVAVTQKEPVEIKILKELIKGPNNKQLYRTVPTETKVISAETKEGVCFVNLSQEFKTKHTGGSSGELMTIYSIVNSLTELPQVDKVQFLIDGQKVDVFLHMVFNEPFTRDDSLIKQ